MAIDRKSVADTIKELNLYPHESKTENLIRGAIWIASWVVGIAVNQTNDPRALGGTFFIFSLTLLCEFAPRSKKPLIAQMIHAIFCFLAFMLFLLSLVLVFGTISEPGEGLLLSIMRILGWTIAGVLFFGVVLALAEVHALIYHEDPKTDEEIEAKREEEREKFKERLTGDNKGEKK